VTADAAAGQIDLDDEESERCTEREAVWMWLADLEDRVAEIEALLRIAPGQWGIEARIAEIEAAAEFLPEFNALVDRARVERQHRPLWERRDIEG
jgi:hypothetical protein